MCARKVVRVVQRQHQKVGGKGAIIKNYNNNGDNITVKDNFAHAPRFPENEGDRAA